MRGTFAFECRPRKMESYRGIALIRNNTSLGPHSRTIPMARLVVPVWGAISCERGTPVPERDRSHGVGCSLLRQREAEKHIEIDGKTVRNRAREGETSRLNCWRRKQICFFFVQKYLYESDTKPRGGLRRFRPPPILGSSVTKFASRSALKSVM